MDSAYHQFPGALKLEDPQVLALSRARRLCDAVARHRDFKLVELLRVPVSDEAFSEFLIVDVECDDVPPKNTAGIRYRERLALCASSDDQALVEVLALRKDFPVLMHQNQYSAAGLPISLCLYFESARAVMRTWTPEAFLRRIQWWLERSSHGDLHAADQPPEHLFFASKYELVLPWNYDDLIRENTRNFVVVRQTDRKNGGFTSFLLPADMRMAGAPTIKHIELNLPPIVHGQVERDPTQLGELADLLEAREVDLLDKLRTALREGIDETGVSAADSGQGTVILLHIPISRETGAAPDGIARRAFMIPTGVLELGLSCDALIHHEGRYFVNWLGLGQASEEWKKQLTLPMEVLRQNDCAAARIQSGILEVGPKGVLIGNGSLGSTLLNIWGRAGWGTWTIIDKDHVKPHNLSRHAAYYQHVGLDKAVVAAEMHAAALHGASHITPVVADACEIAAPDVRQALEQAEFVVDASTTLEYPRAVSADDALPRHVSVFVTPNGNAGVLLAEDSARKCKLRTLEAQYYRALIQEEWGATHLVGHVRTFWSGASCRDISMVMPYSRILGQASTLSEQIQAASICDEARIRVWQREPDTASVAGHVVAVAEERQIELVDLKLYIDEGAISQMQLLREQTLPNETGGILLGYYDFNVNSVVVVAGMPPPEDSKHSRTGFERGVLGVKESVEAAANRTAGVVGYIGEWHSHPPGHSAKPSRDDLIQLTHLALGMADDGLPAVQIIIGEKEVGVLQGMAR